MFINEIAIAISDVLDARSKKMPQGFLSAASQYNFDTTSMQH
jgi:hypothetical protein